MKQASFDAKHLVKDHSSQNVPLTFEEARLLGDYMLRGCRGDALAQIQSVAILTALHNKATYEWQPDKTAGMCHNGHGLPETAAEQIAGVCAAVFQDDIAKSEFKFLSPHVPYVMDNCGMGGDLVVTANISTIAAFIAAAAGIPMCKHGSPANADKGRHGSSDFVEMCGINRFPHKTKVEQCVKLLCFGYTEALDPRYKHIHLQTHKAAQLPHMNDIIGPITNPVMPRLLTRRVLGVNHLIPLKIVAQVYQILNKKGITNLQHGIFVRGFGDNDYEGGMDELSICLGGTQVIQLKDGGIRKGKIAAQDFGLEPVPVESISPPKGMSKGDFSMAILKNQISGAPAQMAAANAALLFYLDERSSDFKECYRMAEEILKSGKAYKRMLEIQSAVPK